jgi:hypothetical protein
MRSSSKSLWALGLASCQTTTLSVTIRTSQHRHEIRASLAGGVVPDGFIARTAPIERHDRGETLTLGASPDHCHLFGKGGRAFERRIVEVLSVA